MKAIALVGDYAAGVTAHRAIPRALELARRELGAEVNWEWVATRDIHQAARELGRFAGIWIVPASPYENMAGALAAIRFARETGRPLLGTCGGFQHALIEIARNVAGIAGADHAETSPNGAAAVVSRLACSLVERTAEVVFAQGSRFAEVYRAERAREGYRCNYGLNPAYRAALERAGVAFTVRDETGEVRGAELPRALHPFFLGTLFQPERAALRGETPPLARALVHAVMAHEV